MASNEQLVKSLALPEDTLTLLRTAQGEEFQVVKNKFLTALFNKISQVYVDMLDAENPFARFYGRPIKYGDTIENIFVETPEGYDFNNNPNKVENGGSPFKKALPSVKTLYATLNFQQQYKTTISDVEIRRAAYNPEGFSDLISRIIGSLPVSATLDRYFAVIAMLGNENIYADGIEQVEVTAQTRASIATKKLVSAYTNMKFPNTKNNKMGVLNRTPLDRLLLVIKQDVLNDINLDYLAGVYNLDKVDLIKKIIPIESFAVTYRNTEGELVTTEDNIDFVMLDTKGLDLHNALEDSGLLYNPEELYTNHFYNVWDIISYKYFYNARAYKLVTEVEA